MDPQEQRVGGRELPILQLEADCLLILLELSRGGRPPLKVMADFFMQVDHLVASAVVHRLGEHSKLQVVD